jgi:hypothetical protein
VGAHVEGWTRVGRAQRARTKLKRAARAYVEACDLVAAAPSLGAWEGQLVAWRRLVHAARILTLALEGSPSTD